MIVRDEGWARLALKVLDRLRARVVASMDHPAERQSIRMLVRYEDALAVDWTVPAPWATGLRAVVNEHLSTAWIMHPPGESSGGHQNIFRFLRYLEDAGHHATVYLYHSADHAIDAAYLQRLIHRNPSYPQVVAPFRVWEDHGVDPATDLVVATGWETAYPAYRDPSAAPRAYFVQDFEPSFYPVGSEHQLAENTYRFGFTGITAGDWLATKLHRDYGMVTHSFPFAADTDYYRIVRSGPRQDVFFYARPVTTRRGFELGVMTMQHLKRIRPDVTIHLAGWDVSDYDLPFEHIDHGAMQVSELNDLYNRCGAALVLSLTNLSLLPLELLAAGVVPVVNDAENNRLVSDNPYIRYCEPSPAALARALDEVLSRPDAEVYAQAASASVRGGGWDASGALFVKAIEDAARG